MRRREQTRIQRSTVLQAAACVAGLLVLACSLCGCASVTLAGTGGGPPSQPPPTPGGNGPVTIKPDVAALLQGQTLQFTASSSSGTAFQWSVTGGGSIDQKGNYTAPATVSQSENVVIKAALASNAQDYATAVLSVIKPGLVICPPYTNNPQVARYSVYLPAPGKASVEFGTDTSYGLNTWQVAPASTKGGAISLWVAGMRGGTLYHMRGRIALDNGATLDDADQTCKTGTPPATAPVQVTAKGTPQPGIEMWNTVLPADDLQAFATDLQGNVIWTYTYPHTLQEDIQGVQMLPNGNLLMIVSYLSSIEYPNADQMIDEIREVDLDGNTVRSVTMNSLNVSLAASTTLHDAAGNPYQFVSMHHDVLPLPNGHLVVLVTDRRTESGGAAGGQQSVLGDALVDVDANGNPDWVWDAFDHLDVNRHPMNFPDWTHSNAMLYSADDHNLLLSIRHQNWIIKIEFLDGAGSGKVMWRLGKDGDFKLVGGVDPTDWFYAQHGMSYTTANTTGVFGMVLMDNGNDRYFPSGQVVCNPFKPPLPAGCYSTVPVLQLDENAMTATIVKRYAPTPSIFSFFGGNAQLLANGDYEAGFGASQQSAGLVQELDPQAQQVVWQAATPGADQYHLTRWPSLYPGVQW